MTNKRLISAFFPYVFCIVLYSCCATLNSYLVKNYLLQNSFSFTEIDRIDFYKLFGYIISPLLLLLRSQLFGSKQVLILSLSVYMLSILGAIYVPSYSIMKFYSLACAASSTIVAVIILCKLLIDTKIPPKYSASFFFASWLVGYLCAEIILSLFLDDNKNTSLFNWIILNTIPIIGVFLNILFSKNFELKASNRAPNFIIIVKNMELETIAGFMIFYVFMVILNGYEVFALTEHLLILSVTNAKYYMIGAILGGIYALPKLQKSTNMYKANIVCLGILLLIFATMPIWGLYYFTSAVLWVFIGILLYVFFIFNILILTEKFDSVDLYYAILIFCLSSAVGFYAGYVTIDATEDTIGENGFLISICFVLLALMVYYMLRFKKDKLSKWTKN